MPPTAWGRRRGRGSPWYSSMSSRRRRSDRTCLPSRADWCSSSPQWRRKRTRPLRTGRSSAACPASQGQESRPSLAAPSAMASPSVSAPARPAHRRAHPANEKASDRGERPTRRRAQYCQHEQTFSHKHLHPGPQRTLPQPSYGGTVCCSPEQVSPFVGPTAESHVMVWSGMLAAAVDRRVTYAHPRAADAVPAFDSISRSVQPEVLIAGSHTWHRCLGLTSPRSRIARRWCSAPAVRSSCKQR